MWFCNDIFFLLDSNVKKEKKMAKVPTRQLGKNGPQVSVLGFGAMSISIGYATPSSSDEERKVFDRVIELGCTYIDSADIYGDNEELLGKYFKKYPEQRKKVSTSNNQLCR
jgi:aryl-alcohol dehydrogenase-like predicted oxidoreductase